MYRMVRGIRTTVCEDQSLVPYHLATDQKLVLEVRFELTKAMPTAYKAVPVVHLGTPALLVYNRDDCCFSQREKDVCYIFIFLIAQ